ncbi:hypothetical protein NVIRPANT_00573 [Pantoea sp. Nvir]|nr:hypothetical protein NVIRPANT_00573 [Pantoea sp. Nvir]
MIDTDRFLVVWSPKGNHTVLIKEAEHVTAYNKGY